VGCRGQAELERYGWVKFVGVLRFAQDDSKNRQQQRQRQERATARQGQEQRQEQPQIPPLRYGMTNKIAANGKSKGNSKNRGNSKGSGGGWGGRVTSFRWCLE
jgi:hypothetical protein